MFYFGSDWIEFQCNSSKIAKISLHKAKKEDKVEDFESKSLTEGQVLNG